MSAALATVESLLQSAQSVRELSGAHAAELRVLGDVDRLLDVVEGPTRRIESALRALEPAATAPEVFLVRAEASMKELVALCETRVAAVDWNRLLTGERFLIDVATTLRNARESLLPALVRETREHPFVGATGFGVLRRRERREASARC